MEAQNEDVPLPGEPLKTAIIYNLKKEETSPVEDEQAEYDCKETIEAINGVLERNGYKTVTLEADTSLFERLIAEKPDFAFNIAEGIRGRGREAQVPALLDMLGIPYTGSDETTLAVALDKALTKRLLRTYRVKTPDYAVLTAKSMKAGGLHFPVIVKPDAEGSSKGILEKSVVRSRLELLELAERDFKRYGDIPLLAEEYIDGREFTVGLLGNGESLRVFEPMEISFKKPTQDSFSVYSFNVKKEYKKYIEYKCPSDISLSVREEMKRISAKIFEALGCRDFARIDYRVSSDGEIHFIEINPLPGLMPGYSDYPMLAGLCGEDYDSLIMDIFNAALQRCGFAQRSV